MSEFGSGTTTDEVLGGVDLTGRRVLITGAAVGLGRELFKQVVDNRDQSRLFVHRNDSLHHFVMTLYNSVELTFILFIAVQCQFRSRYQ